jgi:hypothetical protein
LSLGFQKSTAELGIYVRGVGEEKLIVGVYVDDLISTGHHGINKFKAEMKKIFKMSDLGLLSYYLGLEVKQTEEGITVEQSAYATKLVDKSGLRGCNPCASPLETRLKLSKKIDSPLVIATEYRSMVGSLRYVVNTRPDIAYALGFVGRFLEEPHEDHSAAVKHILRYVSETHDHGLIYRRKEKGGGTTQLIGFSDSDFAGDVDDWKSTTGVLFCSGQSPITWQSNKQKVVALSSCEAEYIAAGSAACQGVWLARLLKELLGSESRAPVLKVDNKSAIDLSKNPVHHDRSKHIEVKYHFIRECVEGGKIIIEQIPTKDQLADIMTKSLGRVLFQELRDRIGIVNIKIRT